MDDTLIIKVLKAISDLSIKRNWWKDHINFSYVWIGKDNNGRKVIKIDSDKLKDFKRLYIEENKYTHEIIQMMVGRILEYNKDLKGSGIAVDLHYIDKDTLEIKEYRMTL